MPARLLKMLLLAGMALCGRVWLWRETVPDGCWLALVISGWACFRCYLRGQRVDRGAPAPRSGWSAPAWAGACGVSAYAANVAGAPDLVTVAACLVLGLLARPRVWLAVVAMVAISVNLVAWVLVRAGMSGAAYDLAAMGMAWGCGLAVAGATLLLLRGPPAPLAAVFALGSKPKHDAWAAWHGRLLVASAACVPLGEGLALIMLALLGLMVIARRAAIPWALLRRHRACTAMAAALACWLGAGAWALVIGGEGWLKPSELGRWAPYLALGLPVLSVQAVPVRYFRAAASAFVGALLLACAVGLTMHGFDIRPGRGVLNFLPVPSPQAWVPHTTRAVAGGFYFHRLKMAHVLLVGIAALGGRQVCLRLLPRRRLLELVGLGLMGATLFYTFARGAWLGLLAMVGVWLLLMSWRWRVALVVASMLACMGVMTLPQQRARLISMGDPAASAIRATVWEQAVVVLREHPFGVGLGNYTPVIGRYYDRIDPKHDFPRTYPHNMILGAWAETGPVGLSGYVAAWVIFMAVCVAAIRRGGLDDREQAAVGTTGLAAAAALWVVGLTHDVLFHNAVALAFCGMAGLVLALLIAPPEHI